MRRKKVGVDFVGCLLLMVVALILLVLSRANKKQSGEQRSPVNSVSTKPSEPCAPYSLKKNELPQGSYLIGRDIPPGTYDFFVVYGSDGKFDIAMYNTDGKIVDGTWDFYWVGLKNNYEKKELIHIACKNGYTITISGNVILRIAKSNNVMIDL